jgi:predicted HicB family RNase H-like nuclease
MNYGEFSMTETEQATEVTASEQGLPQQVCQAAQAIYCGNPDWVAFFREVLGLNGIVRQCFSSQDALAEFERTEAYAEIQQMLTRLRERAVESANPPEPTRVITVRLPKSLHDALRAEAHEHRTSMNKLCISKLLQFIDTELVPSDT